MRWPPERIEALARIIAERVPVDVLRKVVTLFDIVDFDTVVKDGPEKPAEKAYFAAHKILAAHDEREQATPFAASLYERLWADAAIGPALVPFTARDDAALQGSLVKRQATLGDAKLGQFMEETRGRICLVGVSATIAGEVKFTSGTGFLVGPHLVLTARHVLPWHIRGNEQIKPSPGRVGAYFDHFSGDPITDFLDGAMKSKFVAFADDWLVTTSGAMPRDGLFREPTPEQVEKLRECLDVVLVRLAQPIGYTTRSAFGGLRRLWFELPDDTVPARLKADDRIIIRQHPYGQPLQIDFGRFKQSDTSSTRIRYTTETAEGTSGAPCFNQEFKLVGMHNAEFRPDGPRTELNQAIRFDHIARKIRDELKGFDVTVPARIWNVAATVESPAVIFGRVPFLEWITRASTGLPGLRRDRLCAVVGQKNGSGRSFSVDILRAALPDPLDRIVVLGTDTDGVSELVPDFISAIADQLRVGIDLAGLPARPGTELPPNSGDGDKLYKWASEDVPRWLEGELRKRRAHVVDRREEARAIVDLYRSQNRTPPADEAMLAQSLEERREVRYRWERIWIVIDRLNEEKQTDQARLSDDVRNLIACLTGGRIEENALSEEFRRLRWIFLGQKPDFILDSAISREDLDPAAIGIDDMIASIGLFADAFNKPLTDDAVVAYRATLDEWMEGEEVKEKLKVGRLAAMQKRIARLAPFLIKQFRA
jgi:hypothetical protein